jgi:purine-cytosine permease-like protein
LSTTSPGAELSARLDKLYEFEREPVSEDQLQPGRRYPGLFAGEHVAATEFVIGVLFVKWGACARDLVWGLVLGNALAVLSWAFICAPIAVQVRLTLYWYVRRIIGPGLTVVYNFVNGVLFCCLAAAMIGVSASAVIMALEKLTGLHVEHPRLEDLYPNSAGWVIVVLVVGAVVVALAVMGFKTLSRFSTVCSPWMFMVFIAGAVASLPKLGEVRDMAGLWRVAEQRIWTGRPYEAYIGPAPADQLPPAGPSSLASRQNGADRVVRPGPDGRPALYRVLPKLGFWHIAFFAWFCNLATHVGLSDLALFRYARHWYYGFHSAFGMYLGHFLAWICAGVMGAAFGEGLKPGPMADAAAGVAGLLAVLLAGWTTANPTIYRAGLALQIITPGWPRWKVTVAAGAIATVVGCFPAIFMRLLDFVAIYGLVLMPIGAVVLVEHWLFPAIGWTRYWTEKRGLSVNPAALISWALVMVLSFPIEDFTAGRVKSPMELLGLALFFRWLPGWFIAAGTYIALAPLFGATCPVVAEAPAPAARPATPAARGPSPAAGRPDVLYRLSGAAALGSLLWCLYLPFPVLLGGSDPQVYAANMARYKSLYLVATIIYFAAATFWYHRREQMAGRD